jgi:hypothetical protein
MIGRCTNPTDGSYEYYGGRGITVCAEWCRLGGFARFLAHIGPRPNDSLQVDRIDNSRGYEPGNVRWATRVEQARNKRNSRMIEFRGETLPLAAWAERTGIGTTTIAVRLKLGWSVEDALTRPIDERRTGRRRAAAV